jgi:hypothetical protein
MDSGTCCTRRMQCLSHFEEMHFSFMINMFESKIQGLLPVFSSQKSQVSVVHVEVRFLVSGSQMALCGDERPLCANLED